MHSFIRKLLRYNGILHIHLHPNSYLLPSIFNNLCEAYLGTELTSTSSATYSS